MRQLSRFDLSMFLLRFRHLAAAGLSADQALAQISGSAADSVFRNFLQQSTALLRNGASLPDALCPHSGHPFPPFLHNSMHMAGIGENGLELALTCTAEYVELSPDNDSTQAQVAKFFLMSVPVIFFIVLALFVIPVFAKMYADFGGELPFLTTFVISASSFVVKYILLILPFLGSCGWYYLKHQRLKLRDQDRAVAFRLLGAVVAKKFPVAEALRLAAHSAPNGVLRQQLDQAAALLHNGMQFVEALRQSHLISSYAVSLWSLGERGGITEQLAGLADHFHRRAVLAASRKSMAAEISIFLSVVVVIVMMVGLYLPIFKLAGAVGG